jgi:hypothetical protein
MPTVETWIPLAAMLTGVVVVGTIAVTLVRIFTGPVGQALGRRINARSGQPDPDLMNEMVALRSELEHVQQRLTDAEERLDFSERMLAQKSSASPEGTLR